MSLIEHTALLAAACVAAGIACAFAWRRGAAEAGAWAGLLVLGQAAQLRIIEAGPVAGYQHYVLLPGILADPVAGGLLGMQLVLVAGGVWRHRRRIGAAVGTLGKSSIAAIAALSIALSVAPSAELGYWAREIFIGASIQLLALANAGLVALAWAGAGGSGAIRVPDGGSGGPGRAAPDSGRERVDRFAFAVALAVLVLCAGLAVLVYERHPHVPDEVVYLYHARYFAAGELAMAAPPVPAGFDIDLMMLDGGRWFSPVPPGWPAILAFGAKLGAPWLVNPFLAAICILCLYLVAWRLYDDRATARLAIALLAASPWFLFLGMSYMTHHASLALALGAAYGILRWRDSRGIGWLALAGILSGLVGFVRPLEAAIVAGFLGLCALWLSRRRWLVPALVFGLPALVVGLLQLPYNAELTGSATEFPIMAYADAYYEPGANALGFGPNRGLGWSQLDPFPGHGPPDVAVNTGLNSYAINVELYGWASGTALVLLPLLAFLRRRAPSTSRAGTGAGTGRGGFTGIEAALLGAILTVAGVHALYWFSGGPDFGGRYWFLVIAPLVLLTARGLAHAARRASPGVAAAVAALGWAALTTFVPWRAVDKYEGYRGMTPWARPLAADPALRNALVLVRGDRHPDYASAAVYNPIGLGEEAEGPIFAWYRDEPTRHELEGAYPDRDIVVVDGPTISGGAEGARDDGFFR